VGEKNKKYYFLDSRIRENDKKKQMLNKNILPSGRQVQHDKQRGIVIPVCLKPESKKSQMLNLPEVGKLHRFRMTNTRLARCKQVENDKNFLFW